MNSIFIPLCEYPGLKASVGKRRCFASEGFRSRRSLGEDPPTVRLGSFIFLFLVVFPLGQIIRVGILQPIDVIVGAAAIYSIVKKLPRPPVFKYLENFLFIAAVSWIFSLFLFPQVEVAYGVLYLFRLAAYFYFLIYVWSFVRVKKGNGELLINSLLIVSIASALLGWVQFAWVPSLRPFMVWGWDEHLFRLVGTFLDPTYLGLIIVFGLLISMAKFTETLKKQYLFIVMFLLISLAFTYSRASYLAFFTGSVFTGIYKKKLRMVAFSILTLLALVLLLPTSASPVLRLTRSFSAIARIENYKDAFQVFSKSPVIGIGYDNLCMAYQKYIGIQSFSSHACSGSDSSILFILATTGIAGFLVLVFSVIQISNLLPQGAEVQVLTSTFAALLVHSLFANSIFYPWIMGWMMILLAVSLGRKVES